MWGWLGRCRWLILVEKSVDERRRGLEASEERPLRVEDLRLGGPSEGLRLRPSSSAMLPFARAPGCRYRDLPSSDACCSCCCWPLQAPHVHGTVSVHLVTPDELLPVLSRTWL